MAFPTSPSTYDFYNGYYYDSLWKKGIIADSGSITNGNWIKYPNGVMFQWGIEPLIENADYITYPLTFSTVPVVTAESPRTSYNTNIGVSNTGPTTTQVRIYMKHVVTDVNPGPTDVHWVAYGLWKTFEPFSIDMDGITIGSRYYDSTIGAYKKIPPIQSGSNTNGWWIEFDDSTLIQWGMKVGINATVITYPRSFYSYEPSVMCNIPRSGYRVSVGASDVNPTITSFIPRIELNEINTAYTTDSDIHWMAHGRSR